jgi:fibronectin type 3 domain-containing protein
MLRFCMVFALVFAGESALAQQTRVLVQNALIGTRQQPVVTVKWYSSSLTYATGVNVYRQQEGETTWLKLTSTPLRLSRTVPAALLQRDEDLEGFLDMARQAANEGQEGLVMLNLFVKSFQSADFARLLGIQWDDATVQWGERYTYKITLVKGNGEADLAMSARVEAGTYTAFKSVEDFTVTQQGTLANMHWREDQQRFYGVNVYRSTTVDAVWKKLNSTPIVQSQTEGAPASGVMYQDADLREGLTYRYRLTGLDFFGGETEPTPVQEISVGDLTPPPAPLNLQRSVNKMIVTLQWHIQSSSDLAGFNVYRSTASAGPFSKVHQTSAGEGDTLYVDNVPSPAFYYYYVAAADAAGNERASETVLAEVPDMLPPGVPQHVTIKADTGKMQITWSPVKEPDLKGYYVYRAVDDSDRKSFVLINADPIQDTTFVQTLPANAANRFKFCVASVDTAFNRSEPSLVTEARLPDITPPVMPSIKSAVQQGDSVIITWLSNTERDLAGYGLYRFTSEQVTGEDRPVQRLAATTTEWIDTIGYAYKVFYRVRAVDSVGNLSVYSDPFPVVNTKSSAPLFRQFVADYTKREKGVVLRWVTTQKPEGYTVFRKAREEGGWKPLTGLIENTDFIDRSVDKKGKYEYQVRAYSSSGKASFSKTVLVSTGK